MKDYRDMLSSLKDKVVDAAGKAVSDEMRDKVAGAAHTVGERAKYASRMTRLTVDCNAELERVKRTYTEMFLKPIEALDLHDPMKGEAYDELSPLLHRMDKQNHKIQAQMDELRAAAREYRPAPDLHTIDAEEVIDPQDIEVEVTEEPAPEE